MHRREYLKSSAISMGAIGIAGCNSNNNNSSNSSNGSNSSNLVLRTAGEETGSHAAGVGISQVVNDNSDSMELNPRTSPGTSANIRLLDEGEGDIAIGSSIDMLNAFEGNDPYVDPIVQMIMCQTFPIFITDTFIFKRDTSEFEDVTTVNEIPEGASVTWGEQANPSFGVVTRTLEAIGISNDRFDMSYVSLGDYATAYQEGRADFFGSFSINQSALPGYIQELDNVGELNIVRWPDELNQELLNQAGLPFLESTVSNDVFQNDLSVDEFTASSWVYTLMVPESVDAEISREITDIVMTNPSSIREFHDVLGNIGPQFAEERTVVAEAMPVHPGTEQWHKDNGSWNEDWTSLDEVERPV